MLQNEMHQRDFLSEVENEKDVIDSYFTSFLQFFTAADQGTSTDI